MCKVLTSDPGLDAGADLINVVDVSDPENLTLLDSIPYPNEGALGLSVKVWLLSFLPYTGGTGREEREGGGEEGRERKGEGGREGERGRGGRQR